jgi:hypothetical protein
VAIARLAETYGAASGTGSTTYDVAITAPSSTPNGVCVMVGQIASAADQVVSVTYGIAGGAVPLTERRFVPIVGGEASAVYLYWASGVTFPSGAQTIRIIKTIATSNLRAAICPMTVAAGQQASVDVDVASVNGTGAANPSWNMVTVAAVTECYEAIVSGLQTMTTTPRTSPVTWTLIGATDETAQGRGFARTSRTSAGETSPGWTAATAEDWVAASIAFKEAPLVAPSVAARRRPRGLPHYRR